MSEHIRIISAIINLIIGTAVAFAVYQKHRIYGFPYLKQLAHYVILINGGFFLLLSAKYFELNLMDSFTPEQVYVLRDTAIIVAIILLGSVVLKLHSLKWSFRREEKRVLSIWLVAIGLLMTLASYPVSYVILSGEKPNWLGTIRDLGLLLLIITEIAQQIGMLRYGWVEREDSILSRHLGWLLLSRYLFVISALLIAGILSGWPIPDTVAPFIAFLVLIYLNAVPLIWLNKSFAVHATGLGSLIDEDGALVLFFERFDISKREQELVRMLLDGKSNKQIEESLYISRHTVKNHLYNIYKKLGINSRYELVRMVTQFTRQRQIN